MATELQELQRKLWEAADQLRANSGLKASEYSSPVLGLIFLRYAEKRFAAATRSSGQGLGSAQDRQGRLPRAGRHLPARRGPLRPPARPARGRRPRQGRQRRHGGHRGRQPRPRRRAARDLLVLAERRHGRAAPPARPATRVDRGRRLRAGLRVLPRQVRHVRGPEGRRVLHPDLDRQADRRDHRALPRQDLRPGLRLGRHVRPVRRLRRAPPQGPRLRALGLRPGEDRGDRPPRQDEPRRPRPLRRHPRGQHLLRGPPRLGRQRSTS